MRSAMRNALPDALPNAMQRRGEERRGLRGESSYLNLDTLLSSPSGGQKRPCICLDKLDSCPDNCLLRWY